MSQSLSAVRRKLIEAELVAELLQTHLVWVRIEKQWSTTDLRLLGTASSVAQRKRYGLARVARTFQLSRPALYRCVSSNSTACHSATPLTDEEIAERIKQLIDESPLPAERHRKLWARLRRAGVMVSRERTRRIIREYRLIPGGGTHPGIIPPEANLVWGMDSASVPLPGGITGHVCFVIDHFTLACLAIDAVNEETSDGWLALLRAADVNGGVRRSWTTVRCDNHPAYRERSLIDAIGILQLRLNPIPPLRPQLNGVAERFVRTLRENLLSIRGFADIGVLASEVRQFREIYNHHALIQRHGYRSPAEVALECAARRVPAHRPARPSVRTLPASTRV